MVKGVNKHIIEISDTGSDCFERVILFVRENSIDKGHDHLYRRAKQYLSGLSIPSRIVRGKRHIALRIAKYGGAAALGAAVAGALLLKM